MATTKKFNFQKSFAELEKLVERFERGDIDLDEGLKEFERGLELAEQLKSKLRDVENKVEKIKAKFGDEN